MRTFYKKSQDCIAAIYRVLETVEGVISTRQMYYQLISQGVIPPTNAGYMKIQRLLVELRRENIIPSDRICDRTRNKHKRPSWDGLSDILEACRIQYRRDYWSEQDVAVYIAVEKQALEGVFAEVCDEYGVGLFVLRGYPSYSLLYDWAQEIIELREMGKEVKIYYFGDFDATGMHIDESVAGQIFEFVSPELGNKWKLINSTMGREFAKEQLGNTEMEFNFVDMMNGRDCVSFRRVGVLPEDINNFDFLTLPVKRTDTRAKAFIEKYGDWSIVQYIRAVETEDQELRQNIMDDILKYNAEDLQATWAVVQWLRTKQ